MPRKARAEPKVVLFVKVPGELRDALLAEAERRGLSMTAVVIQMLERELKEGR